MKIFIRVLIALVLILAVVIGLNWSKIQRLQTVNTLFDEDKIVENFSNMDAAFLHQDLEAGGEPFVWPENPTPLPDTVMVAGKPYDLEKLLEELETTSFIVIQDGQILNEQYFLGTDKDDLRISWSVAKSFMSGLYGKALESGDVKSLDDTVETYVPELKGSAYEGATIRNVLNMASGVKFNEDYMDPKSDINKMGRVLGLGQSMDKFAAGLTEREAAPGERWQYVSIDTHIGAMVLRAATGKSLHQLFNETYGAHLGFGKAPYYLTDGKNVAFALGGLNLRTRDYAKFGQLFLQGGEWNGEQIIPADWVEASTEHSAPTMSERGVGYGYQWWVPMPQENTLHEGDFFAVGIYGQYIYVNPTANLVIAKNAAHRTFTSPMPQFGEGYGHSMNVNIDMFRSLAEHYTYRYFENGQLDDFHVHWFSRHLRAMKEPSLRVMNNDGVEQYRFLWLRTFHHPMSVTVTKQADGTATVSTKSTTGQGGYFPGELEVDTSTALTAAQYDAFKASFEMVDVCGTEPPDSIGLDGAEWIFEYGSDAQHCAVNVWSPKDDAYAALGRTFLSLTGLSDTEIGDVY